MNTHLCEEGFMTTDRDKRELGRTSRGLSCGEWRKIQLGRALVFSEDEDEHAGITPQVVLG